MNETSALLMEPEVLNAVKAYMHESRGPSADCFELMSLLSWRNFTKFGCNKEQLSRMDNFTRTLLEKRSDFKIGNSNDEQHPRNVNNNAIYNCKCK